MKKSLLFITTLLLFTFFIQAQNTTISGKIIGAADKAPVAFGAVALLQLPDSTLVKGTTTDLDGLFKLENVSAGNYTLKIQVLSFKDYFTPPFIIQQNDTEKKLGTIALQADVQRIKQVEVTAEKPFVQQQADKKVYNVEKNITSTGGTANDIIQNIPSVSQDADGNISLRGSENVSILINGKPSTIAGGDKAQILQQIPANTIQSVEIITNPSSKYDAEGSAGIINIVTKRNEKENLSGNVGANFTVYNKAGGNVALNYKNKHYSLGASYSANYNPRFSEGYSKRQNIFADTTFASEQITNGDRIPLNQNARITGEYYAGKYNIIGANFSVNAEKSESPETIEFLNYDSNNLLGDKRIRNVVNDRKSLNLDAGLNYKRTFKKKGRELTLDATFSNNERNETFVFEDTYTILNYLPGSYNYRFSQINKDNGTTTQYIGQADYTHAINKSSKIETGVKASVRDIAGDYVLDNLDTISNEYIPDSLNGSRIFNYVEQVYAAYVNYSNKFKDFSYQFGLRGEQTFIDGSGKSFTTPDASINRSYFNIFPTGFLAYTFKKQHQLQLSYTKRISRPWFRQLMPFVEVSDPFNLRIGNPNLNPEIFHSIEFGWNKTFSKHFTSANIYYRQTNNNIGRIRTLNEEGISIVSFENLNKQYSYGIELIARNNWFKWWDMTTSLNGYQTFVNGNNLAAGLSNSGFAYNLKHSQNFRFWKNASFQISASYMSPMPTAQGEMKSIWGIDLALKKDVLKGKGSVTINAQDIFFSRIFGFEQDQPNFQQDFWRRRESRVVTISFNYRFGSSENWNNRKKGRGGSQEGGGMMEDY
jgi:outer membrane cobalamin receptor